MKLSFQVNYRNIGNYIKTESIVKKLCKYKWTAQKGSAMQ